MSKGQLNRALMRLLSFRLIRYVKVRCPITCHYTFTIKKHFFSQNMFLKIDQLTNEKKRKEKNVLENATLGGMQCGQIGQFLEGLSGKTWKHFWLLWTISLLSKNWRGYFWRKKLGHFLFQHLVTLVACRYPTLILSSFALRKIYSKR